jgi:hypothetical protein
MADVDRGKPHMTPIDRLYTALDGGIPDRVPTVPKIWVDLGATLTGTDLIQVIEDPLTALSVIADAGLQLGVDAVRQFPFPPRKTLRQGDTCYEIDAKGRRLGKIDMEGGLTTQLEDASDYRLEDPVCMTYFHYRRAPEPPVRSVADARRIAVPQPSLFDQLGWGERHEQVRRRVGDRLALIGDCSAATIAFYIYFRGLEQAMFDLTEQPQLVHATLEKGVAIAVAKGKYWIDRGLKILRLNDSAGNMSLISPRHWREFVFPHLKVVCEELHAYDPRVRIYCHICGNVMPVARDLVEAGLDCIGPLDPLGGSTCEQMRQTVGQRVSLMGGVDTSSFVNATPEKLMAEAKRCIQAAGREGGYVLGSGCVIPRSAKRENLEALVEAARLHGSYDGGKLRCL